MDAWLGAFRGKMLWITEFAHGHPIINTLSSFFRVAWSTKWLNIVDSIESTVR